MSNFMFMFYITFSFLFLAAGIKLFVSMVTEPSERNGETTIAGIVMGCFLIIGAILFFLAVDSIPTFA